MAESYRQKVRRWARNDFTKAEMQGIIGLMVTDKVIDVATGGRLNKLTKAALGRAFTLSRPVVSLGGRLAGQAALGAGRVLGSSAIGAAAPIVTNPYALGLGLGGLALASEPGQQLLESAEERGRMDRIRFEQGLTDLEFGLKKRVKRTKSKFNSAVSKGMSAVKKSTSYGKKGVINAPKKAFKVVVSLASKMNKGSKPGHRMPVMPKSKLGRDLFKAMKGAFRL
jgi:hypothetical protein